jgi:hypothetical protein
MCGASCKGWSFLTVCYFFYKYENHLYLGLPDKAFGTKLRAEPSTNAGLSGWACRAELPIHGHTFFLTQGFQLRLKTIH